MYAEETVVIHCKDTTSSMCIYKIVLRLEETKQDCDLLSVIRNLLSKITNQLKLVDSE